jgi:hypothetical protein
VTKDQNIPSPRAEARASARTRGEAKAAVRQVAVDAVAAGWSIEQIAEMRKVSPRTVRREMGRALAERRLDAPDRYAHLQVARLARALRLADAALDRGELKAIGPLVKVVKALDRYHGLAAQTRAGLPASPTAAPLPAPPLRLTCLSPPPTEAAPDGGELATEPLGVACDL